MMDSDKSVQISVYKNIGGLSILNCKISGAGVQAKGKLLPWEAVAGVAEFPEMQSLIARTPASACLVFGDGTYIRLTSEQTIKIKPDEKEYSYLDLLKEIKSKAKDFSWHSDKISTMTEEKIVEIVIASNILFAAVLLLFLYGGGLPLALEVAPLNMIGFLFLIPTLFAYNRRKRNLRLTVTGQKKSISS